MKTDRYTNRTVPFVYFLKGRTLFSLFLLLILTLVAGKAWGTEITSLSSISSDITGDYVITADIDASSFTTISSFSGTLEAAINPTTHMPYRIKNLKAPLFTTLTGTVKNIVLESVGISDHSGNTGAIACTANGSARIYNVGILSGSVGGTAYTGGLVGFLDGQAHVVNCYSFATITGGTTVGGIVGYNNVASTQSNINTTTHVLEATMVMNCMFYGDITGGTTPSPVYGGQNINNLNSGGLTTFNYYAFDKLKSKTIADANYKCALAVEERFLNRFDIYRQLLNSNKKLAAIYATGSADNANQMLKWVLETADRSISSHKPYPILKAQGSYPSIINIDVEHAPDSATVGRNKGGKVGRTLAVKILKKSEKTTGGQSWPTATTSDVTTTSLTLYRTDKDEDRFNFNYDKVQLPYYNDVGTGNYTENRVVTGWKITEVTGGTAGTFSETDEYGGYNFADRKCTQKDVYSVSKRVFSQGAYYDVPYGVTGITIEPYWGVAAYASDQYYDVVYKEVSSNNYSGQSVSGFGTQYNSNPDNTSFNGTTQKVYTTIEAARSSMNIPTSGKTVYDYAVVLVGNVHQAGPLYGGGNTPYTIMSVDLDKDNEPDYSLIFGHYNRQNISSIRFDFLDVPGTAQAQKPNGTAVMLNVSIFNPKGWFEVTNTCLMYFVQFEADNDGKTAAPVIFLGGVVDQYTSTKDKEVDKNGVTRTKYIHLGSNAYFKAFGNGTHSDGWYFTRHVPVSVTGGDFEGFYLSGVYRPDAQITADDAEGYISGGRFEEMAGASQQVIAGDVTWQIYDADITNFYGGGINADKPILGDVTVNIINSHVGTYCGGPKFGDMQKNGTTFSTTYSKNKAGSSTGTYTKSITKDGIVTTNAVGCTFGKFFGAGYGGASTFKLKYYDSTGPNFTNLVKNYKDGNNGDRGKYFDGNTSTYKTDYGNKGPGVATDFDYEFFIWSSGSVGARFYVNYTTLSLAKTNAVNSNLTNCIINGNFYGGGNLGKVEGTATSVLDGCTVYGNVFGGGFSASKEPVPVRDSGFKTGKLPSFNKYSGIFDMGEKSDATNFDWKEGTFPENNKSAIDEANGKHDIITDQSLTSLGQVDDTDLTIKGNTYVQGVGETGGVFGGGDASSVNGNAIVKIEGTSTEGSKVGVKNVYGGGNVANVSGATKVILLGGTVNGDVYGGGKGRLEEGTEGEEGYVSPIAATVGDANVFLNGMEKADYDKNTDNYSSVVTAETDNGPYTVDDANKGCVVKGSIFGCNNLNGTPLGTVLVHIYKTQRDGKSRITNSSEVTDAKVWATKNDKGEYVLSSFDVKAVYGGGNLAAYEPTKATNDITTDDNEAFTEVVIDGCGRTSIGQVYGGGNAASTPATSVTVNGTYEIGEVFGGGNGKDDIIVNGVTKDNPGANVGYTAYDPTYDPPASSVEERTTKFGYGSGKASVNIYGGTIRRVFGGSNTKGNVRQTAVTILDNQDPCVLDIDEAYGGGKSAPMDAEAKLLMACIPGLKAAYGGAQAADVQNNVVLNITNGTFERVFGGNNVSGTIKGSITVNIEETGCVPLIIGELYGGGNLAPYSVYGYDEDGKPIQHAATKAYADPQINVKSFTSIGNIYGGGYGTGAVMYGDPTVNINVTEGKYKEYVGDEDLYGDDYDYDANGYKGNPNKMIDGHKVVIPPHKAGSIGAIQNVFGGGNAAAVVGSTRVNVGTTSKEYVTVPDNDIEVGVTDVSACYTRTGEGTSGSPYVYTVVGTSGSGAGKAEDGVTYYKECEVKGADIKGNVYGGGNQAKVTGSTNVVIGKEDTTTP